MSSEVYNVIPIKELCKRISSGGTPSRNNPSYYEGGSIRWVKTQELQDCQIYDTEEKITLSALEKSSAKLFPKNTIIMAMYGATVGKLGILKVESSTNQACCNMLADPGKLHYRFLYYSLLHNREELIKLACGAAQQNLNLGIISNYGIRAPSITEQREIAATLSCLDDKIELNNRIVKKLEEMAQAIFKSWFVDYEPFQDGEFIDSDLGRIPKGWKVGTLGDVITMSYGKALTAKNRIDGPFPVYSSAGCTGYHNQPLMNERGLVVGRKGTIGTVYYSSVPFFCIDTAYYIPESDASLGLQNTYHLLSYLGLTKYNEDSAVPGLNRNTVYSIRIVIPPADVSRKTEEILEALSVQIEHRKKENMKLQNIRDALLPKLMSGEIRVPIEEA